MTKLSTAIKAMLLVTMVFVLLGICPQTLTAESRITTYYGLSIRYDESTATIVRCLRTQTDYTIPATIKIGQNTITIVGIEKGAFYDCIDLRTLTIPDTVTSIGENAFMNCHNLTTVHMPARLNNLGKGAFNHCSRLQSITIPDGITAIGDTTFSGCSHLAVIRFPNSITHIGSSAFGDCSSLTTITLPSSVNYIGPYAFHNCALRSIVIPSGVTRIYEGTFKDCTTLTQVTIPEGITKIEDFAFLGCSSLTGINLPDSIRGMGMFVFKDCRGLKSISLPGRLTKISTGIFENCSSLTSVSIPSSVTQMEGAVFRGCTNLKSIAIPDSVNCFEGSTFAGCTSLETVKFSSGDPSIGSDEFLNCTSLRSITIPENIISLGDRAFKGCTNLTEVKFLGNAPHPYDFGFNVFDNCAPNFKIKYILGKTGWSNPYNGYPAEAVVDLAADIPNASLPVEINPNALENIPGAITDNKVSLKAEAGVGFVKLDWNQITDNRGVSGYNIYKALSAGTQPGQPAASTTVNQLTYIDTDVKNGATYYYIVKPVFKDQTTGIPSNEVSVSPREAAGTIQLTINNPVMSGNGVTKQIDQGYSTAPVIKDGRTFLPIRAVISEMGGNIEWDGSQRKVTTLFDGRKVELWIGSKKVRVNGTEKTTDAVPYISDTGRTMLPLRFVGESLGCDVNWDAATQSVTIAYDTAAEKTPNTNIPAATSSGVPASLPAPSIANLQLLKDEGGVPYFRLEVTVPDSVITLDKERPANGYVDLESSKKVDDGEWIEDGGGLSVFIEKPVPGKTGAYYLDFELLDHGDLAEISINAGEYTFKTRFNYTYRPGDDDQHVYSPWSNELSGQSESYHQSDEE